MNKRRVVSIMFTILLVAGVVWANTTYTITDSTHDVTFGANATINGTLAMNSTKITNVANGTAATDVAAFGQLTGAVSGTTNTVAKFTGTNAIGNSSITDNGTTVATGEAINLSANLTPSAPGTGLSVSSTLFGGRPMLTTINSLGGEAQMLQSSIGIKSIMTWIPTGDSTAPFTALGLLIGTATPSAGALTARPSTTTNLCTMTRRLGYVSAATAGSVTGQRTNLPASNGPIWRGNASGQGGFFVVMRFMISDAVIVSTGRTFVGIQNSGAAPTDQDPAAETNVFAVGNGSADTTLHMYMSGAAAQTATDLGANFPANTTNTDCYDLYLYAPPNGSSISWQVVRLNTGDTASGTQSTAANLPTNTTQLQPQFWRSNSTTAAAVGIDVMVVHLETDH